MKNFLRILTVALLAVALALPFAFSSAASEPVLFIKDGGTGDGSSASKPLSLEDYSEYYAEGNLHYGSVLFQAAHRLQYTGGTIVLVGEVRLDESNTKGSDANFRDFFMPNHPDSTITITSKYNGVDYGTTKGARLVLERPAQFICGGDTVFRDINICTQQYTKTDNTIAVGTRLICANGYDLTMDIGVKCYTIAPGATTITSTSNVNYLPVIAGGHRYADCIRREGHNTVTIKSGSYGNVVASTYDGSNVSNYGQMISNVDFHISGNSTLIAGYISGGGQVYDDGGIHYGDVSVTIDGATVKGGIYAINGGGFGTDNCTFTLKIISGTISSSNISGTVKSNVTNYTNKLADNTATRTRYAPANSILDLSDCTDITLAKSILSKAQSFTKKLLPAPTADWEAKGFSTALATAPTRSDYYVGDTYDPSGLTFMLYIDNKAYSAAVSYSSLDPHFRFEPSLDTPLTPDVKQVKIYYGEKLVCTRGITVAKRTPIRILGAQIRTSDEKQTLRFLGQVGFKLPEIGLEVVGYGLVIQPTEFFSEKSLDMPGATVIDGTKTKLNSVRMGGYFFTGDIENIPVEEYDVSYSAFAYLIYTHNGKEYTVYSDVIERSVRGVAEAACASNSLEPAAKKTKLNTVLKATSSTRDAALISEKVEQLHDNFEAMSAVKWTPSKTIDLANSEEFVGALIYKAGTTYYGIPYIAAGTNGNISLAQWLSICPNGSTYTGSGITWDTMPGNQCSSSVVRALQTVTNQHSYFNGYSIRYALPKDTHPYYIAVGGYPVSDYALTTQQIIREFGSNFTARSKVVYNAYANAKNGDFLVSDWVSPSTGDVLGHIMIISGVNVKYNSDGSINPKTSVLYVSQQASNLRSTNTTWGIREAVSFETFYNSSHADASYLPIRLRAFEDSYFATPHMTVRERNTADNIQKGLMGKIYSNYQINQVHVKITNSATGAVVKSFSDFPFTTMYYDLRMLDKANELKALASGSYHYELTVGYGDKVEKVVSFDFKK